MSQESIVIILSRHWASNLNTPIFLVDPEGDLIFFNEAAEPLIGMHFAEVGKMTAEAWSTGFDIRDEEGKAIPPEELPLTIALTQQKPAHRRFFTVGQDDVPSIIETSSFPLMNRAGGLVGAVALFWRLDRD
jgi:PAS domain-containing protein